MRPDERVAEALEQAADTARRRSGYAAAARAFQRAAQLTPSGGRRVDRLLAGADAARQAGRFEHALVLLRAAMDESPPARVVVEIDRQRGLLEWYRGRPREGQRLYLEAARLVADADPAWAARLLVEASLAAYDAGNPVDGLAIAREANALAAARGDLADAASLAAIGVGLYWTGATKEAHRVLSRAIAEIDRRHVDELRPDEAALITAWRVWTGVGMDVGRALLGRVLEDTRAAGALGVLPYALAVHVQLLVRDGRWARAYADAAEGARMAQETGTLLQRHVLLGRLAQIEAAQGRERDCRAHADEAAALVQGSELGARPAISEALGLLELGLGRPQEALYHLERATALPAGDSHGTRLSRPSLGDLVEARMRLGSYPQDLIGALRRAAEADFDGSQAVVARTLAQAAGDDDFDAAFADALQSHATDWPFERARTALAYGERLRRAGRRADARAHLRAALETFDVLGAHPWAQRAAGELRATGERFRRRDPTVAEQLTPQELQIALTVASGATNREAGAALFLSHKTIEHHLSQIYRKLGLRSRAELANAVRDAPTREMATASGQS